MPRQYQPLEIKSFAKGLITEANPLEFPPDASIDEVNFDINNDKSRKRRLGMNLEDPHQWRGSVSGVDNKAFSSILWKNAGGVSSNSVLAVQIGKEINFYETDKEGISPNKITYFTINSSPNGTVFDMAVVDSYLVVSTGSPEIHIFEYNSGNITQRTERLFIRDLFGVAVYQNGVNLREGVNVTTRPTQNIPGHIYNLKNQTWALPRINNRGDVNDPISTFEFNLGEFPSNADSVFDAYYEDIGSSAPQQKRFFWEDMKAGPLASVTAPRGFFIIDALDRGSSREDQFAQLKAANPEVDFSVGSLPTDRTKGGSSCVAQYGGRIWFGGFKGQVTDGDEYSPDMSSYLLYSRLVQNKSDINKCYQESDPAGYEAPDLVDTDGGFIRIDGAYDIKRMFDVGAGLIVVASNGAWMVSGGSDYGFSATNNKVSKITERGCDNSSSCVLVDNTVLYWGGDGIYHIRPSQYGDYQANNITENVIQSFYNSIDTVSKLFCQGSYDSYDKKVRWVYNNTFDNLTNTEELVLDITAGAFTKSSIAYSDSCPLKVVSPVEVPPYTNSNINEEVTYNGTLVQYNGEDVTTSTQSFVPSTKEIVYLVTRVRNGLIEYTFSSYNDRSFTDWVGYDGVGVDAEAYMLTGWVNGGDNIRMKQTPYLITHMERTETGFYEEDGGIYAMNPSGCLVRAQWDWTNSPKAGKWGRQFQVYRYRRPYFPSGTQDNFDTGDKLIVTKNKLRGRGRVVSLDIRSEPGKDCHIYGWGMVVGVNNNV